MIYSQRLRKLADLTDEGGRSCRRLRDLERPCQNSDSLSSLKNTLPIAGLVTVHWSSGVLRKAEASRVIDERRKKLG
jgi:hypothetical protein